MGQPFRETTHQVKRTARQGDERLTDTDHFVEFERVQKSYDGEVLVVKDLNLTMPKGEFLTMLGPSGSGKTTCLMMLAGFDMWTNSLFGFSVFGTMSHGKSDADATGKAKDFPKIDYPKPDGKLSFDRLTNVSFSATNHEESQPCHLRLKDPSIPIKLNLPEYAEPGSD